MHALAPHCFRCWLSCNGSWRQYGPTLFEIIAELWPPERKQVFQQETSKQWRNVALLFCMLIGSVCWQSSELRSWKPVKFDLGIWAAQWSCLDRSNFCPAINSSRLRTLWLCSGHASFKSMRLNRGSKPTSNQWSNSFKGWELPQSFSIQFPDFFDKNSHNKPRTANKTKFHDTAV